jgi:hypothetical protein
MGTLQQEPHAAQPLPVAAAHRQQGAAAAPPEPGRQEQQPPQQQGEAAQRHQQAKKAKKEAKRAAKAAEQERLRLGLDPAAAERPPGRCHFFLHKKGAGRFCSFQAVAGGRFCGHHLHEVEGSAQGRVPCPWDSKGGHTVLESELEKHKLRCPSYRLWLAERSQPCFAEDNAGSGPEAAWPPGLQPLAPPPEAAAEAAANGAAAAKQRRRAAGARGGGSLRPARCLCRLPGGGPLCRPPAAGGGCLRSAVRARAAFPVGAPSSRALPPPRVCHLQPPLLAEARPAAGLHCGQHAAAGAGAGGGGGGRRHLCGVWSRQGIPQVGEQAACGWLWGAVGGCEGLQVGG